MANRRLSKEKQALVLSALCEGTPIEAVARMFKIGTNTITRVIRETGEAFSDYMDTNFRDLPCSRIEMDEQWQYVGCHAGRLPKDDTTERGDYWLGACIAERTSGIEAVSAQRAGLQQERGNAQARGRNSLRRLQLRSETSHARHNAKRSRWP